MRKNETNWDHLYKGSHCTAANTNFPSAKSKKVSAYTYTPPSTILIIYWFLSYLSSMSNTKHTTSHHMELKRIIILTLLFILIMLIFRNSVSFKMTFQELLPRFYKKNSNSVSNNNRPSSIFSENLVDFDDVNMVDKTRLFIFLFFSFIITIPFMV